MSSTVVMKFGGTSVGSTDRIGEVAKRVAAHIKKTGDRVVVVVSAMSGETDRLVDFCRKVSGEKYSEREYHQLLSSGEQVTSALTALAIEKQGVKSQSLLAFQVPIKTKKVYGQNLIESIDAQKLQELINAGVVPVVAGFQGVDIDNSYTTLGRGGSDNTAVALAAALGRCKCIIYTDVDGVYTALPSVCKQARKLARLTYEEMLELASGGAKVLQTRSVNLAYKYRVPFVVASSFSNVEGTEIVEEYPGMEDAVVSGITFKNDQVKFTLKGLPDKPGVAAKIFNTIGETGAVVDMIVQSEGGGGVSALSFTVPKESAAVVQEALATMLRKELPGATFDSTQNLAKLSIVGEGMRTHSGVAAQMFEVLGKEGINIELVTTSEISLSVAINQKYSELAVRSLHEFFIEKT